MSLAIYGVHKGTYLPLLYGVPVFIMCGLPHSIADAFYYWVAILNGEFEAWIITAWIMSVVGNYIGCNLPRWFMGDKFEIESQKACSNGHAFFEYLGTKVSEKRITDVLVVETSPNNGKPRV